MKRTPATLPIVALACAALLAGCGSSGTTTTTSSVPTQSTPASSSGTGASSAQIQAAVSECKRIIHSQAKLSETEKTKLEGACAKAANGDTAAVKQVAREVCEEVVNTSPVPGGTAKEAALAACKK